MCPRAAGHQERAMTTPDEYRGFALDCLLWAGDAKDASQRDTIVGIARMWNRAASELDQHFVMARDPTQLSRELRAKLE
jgi:hypothetical protein